MFSLPFSKKSGLLYIRRDKAQLYLIGSSSSIEVVFDKAVFENLEIKDVDAFESALKDIIQKTGSKNMSILIVLSSDIIFRKDLPKLSDVELNDQVSKFIDAIPIDNNKLEYRLMPIEAGVAVFATNSIIYNIARDACETSGCEVQAIVPAAFFGVTSSDITINVFAQIVKSKVLFGGVDFMRKGDRGKIVPNPISVINKNKPAVASIISDKESSSPVGLTMTTKSGNRKSLLMIIFSVILFGATGFLLKKYYFSSETVPLEKANVVQDVPQEVSQDQTVIEDVSSDVVLEDSKVNLIEKVDLRFLILNSTRVSGLASKAKDEIIKNGYSNIEVGNSSEVLENTQIILYKQIPAEYLDEIKVVLKDALDIDIVDVKDDFKEVYDFDLQVTIAGVE